ncbi:MAG: SDR family oxidoreductase [Chloroflexi bacterium]|nr:SDR family oxidoreductase [Chloroflexota bacterium]
MAYEGRTALITGASSGIGAAFARELAGRGMDLVLVARSRERLDSLAQELVGAHLRRVEVVPADLSQRGAAERIATEVAQLGLNVDFLVNNAGFGTYGRFETLSPERDRDEIMVNVLAPVSLAHAFIPSMLQRGGGYVINVGSTAAFQPLAWEAVYGASKAFVLSFSEALWAEYRGRGIHVLALCPGRTATPFFDAVGTTEGAVGVARRPEQVVATGLRALEQGRSHAVDGAANQLMALAPRFLPRTWYALIVCWLLRPGRGSLPFDRRA